MHFLGWRDFDHVLVCLLDNEVRVRDECTRVETAPKRYSPDVDRHARRDARAFYIPYTDHMCITCCDIIRKFINTKSSPTIINTPPSSSTTSSSSISIESLTELTRTRVSFSRHNKNVNNIFKTIARYIHNMNARSDDSNKPTEPTHNKCFTSLPFGSVNPVRPAASSLLFFCDIPRRGSYCA